MFFQMNFIGNGLQNYELFFMKAICHQANKISSHNYNPQVPVIIEYIVQKASIIFLFMVNSSSYF